MGKPTAKRGKKISDKERLDWIEKHAQPVSVEVTITGAKEFFCWHDVMKQPKYCRTIRGAIDAAIRAELHQRGK